MSTARKQPHEYTRAEVDEYCNRHIVEQDKDGFVLGIRGPSPDECPLRFEFEAADRNGKCLVQAFGGDKVLAEERIDPYQPWTCKNMLDVVAETWPAKSLACSEHGGATGLREHIEQVFIAARKKRSGNVNVSTSAPKEIIPYRPFPVDVLPGAVGQFVAEAAAAIGCDASFIGLPTLACLARAIGNKRTIRLKRTWTEPAIVWAAIVGKSGTHKTPALSAATTTLHRKQLEATAQYQEALQQHEQDRALYERDFAAWKRSKTTDPPPWEPEEPALQRYIVSDITIEALADRLHRQFDGVLVVRDELAGWLGGIAEYKGGQGSDLGHWLASWSGAPLTVDRKTGAIKTVNVPRAAVNIVGGIQPGVLRTAIGREHMQDGLCARLLLAMPEQKPVRWTEATVSPATEAAIAKVYDRLLALEPAADEEGNPAPFEIPLTTEAKAIWIAYYNRHRAELAELDDDLAAAWSKLEAYTARFSLIFQLASWAQGEAGDDAVDEASMAAAIKLSDWFGGEAKRVYGILAETEQDREHRELSGLVRRKGGTLTARDLMRCSRRYPVAEDAEAALDALVKAGYGRWEHQPTGPTGGKPTRRFSLVDTVDVDNTHVNTEGNEGYVNVNTVSSQKTHEANGHDIDAINAMLAEMEEEPPT